MNAGSAERLAERIRVWRVEVEETLETPSSLVAFGTRLGQPVVLKVIRQPGDEWCCGAVLDLFDGRGIVNVYEYTEGAVLLERLDPGTSLVSLVLGGGDDAATKIISEVIQRMTPASEAGSGGAGKEFATVADWGKGFAKYQASGDRQLPQNLVEQGEALYAELCASQTNPRLLHGDLQHYNILFDSKRGWTAIDPKGVVGEIEYEVGASLRNPWEAPELLSVPQTIERRLKSYERNLKLDYKRMLRWAFAQAVLSAIWTIEDDDQVDGTNPAMMLAKAMLPILE